MEGAEQAGVIPMEDHLYAFITSDNLNSILHDK